MKNIHIYPKDWLQLHPYKQAGPVEVYYTSIANRVCDCLEKTGLAASFEKEEVSQVGMRMAAYFEDVISQTNMWKTFITTNKELYGQYLPFYTTSDQYYDDEANLEDVQFLLWHYIQQYHGYRKGTFVNPDNPTTCATAGLIYQLFCDEWTTAPENERMQQLFSVDTSYKELYLCDNLLYWFYYNAYLFPNHTRDIMDYIEAKSAYYEEENINADFLHTYRNRAYTRPVGLLPITAPQWISRTIPADHPDYNIWAKLTEEEMSLSIKEPEKDWSETYEKFNRAAEGKLFVYAKDLHEAKEFITNKAGIELGTDFPFSKVNRSNNLAIYATLEEGLSIITNDVEAIKDKENPFYDEKVATQKALGFFIVKHCHRTVLEKMVEQGMLAEAQTISTVSPERGKAIIQENWQFLSRYFISE